MDRDRLQSLLETLHRELVSTRPMDEESRRLLLTVMTDIERILQKSADATPTVAVSSRLDALVVRFEADHPAVAGAMRQLLDALAKAGI